jgi:alginate O-acetyltransferase complex protein AlgI
MVFSSTVFLFLFLPVTLGLYALAGRRLRNLTLLFASLFFYAWGEGVYVGVMLLSILFNYLFGLLVDRSVRYRRLSLFLAVLFNLTLLVTFKYANFLVDNLNVVLSMYAIDAVRLEPVHLPIGISFFTFQAITYVVDVFRGQQPAQTSLFNLGLYISLFPQLIAGPIVRYRDLAGQIMARSVGLSGFASGIGRFIIGLAKKVLIANVLAGVADDIFSRPAADLTVGTVWLGVVCYTLQIYFDFSGYSDMAIGLGRMFGFRFLENFNYPYIAQSLREFWRRWHISLSTWFRDYVYLPLGGSRHGAGRTYANLLIVFVLCGLWHGASWNFAAWGLFHGVFLILERLGLARVLAHLARPLRHGYLLTVVMVSWVLFRADSLDQAGEYLMRMAGLSGAGSAPRPVAPYLDIELTLVLVAAVVCAVPWTPAALRVSRRVDEWVPAMTDSALWQAPRVVVLSALLTASLMSLAAGSYNPFIYFRF